MFTYIDQPLLVVTSSRFRKAEEGGSRPDEAVLHLPLRHQGDRRGGLPAEAPPRPRARGAGGRRRGGLKGMVLLVAPSVDHLSARRRALAHQPTRTSTLTDVGVSSYCLEQDFQISHVLCFSFDQTFSCALAHSCRFSVSSLSETFLCCHFLAGFGC